MISLSDQQQAVVDSLYHGRNTFVTGPGGTGKSLLLNHLRENLGASRRLDVCGSTGIAAVNVGGVTLHSWAGIGLGEGSANKLALGIRNNRNAWDRITKAEILAIDEISMINAELLDKLEEVFRLVRNSDLPFGGVQMLFLGDFYQLPPVEGRFAFRSKAWKEAEVETHVLTRVFRQRDAAFAQALLELRTGELSTASRELLNSRYKAVVGTPERPPVYLTTHNADAQRINDSHLRKLDGSETIFHANDTGTESGIKLLEKGKIPKDLVLKTGARVICCVNYDPNLQIMNGSAGTVTGFGRVSGILSPIVSFDNGSEIPIIKVKKEITLDGKVIACREQFPLRLGYAITTHSSQGMTLELVEAHLGKAFEKGQIYVALSRATSLEGLSIMSLNKELIKPSPEAAAFYASATLSDDYTALLV
jgi:ATP-dependent DNA helicase PIF1